MGPFPLSWPPGWKRTDTGRASGNFGERGRGVTVHQGVQRVLDETRKMGVAHGDTVISTNIPVRLDGMPYSDRQTPADPGVAVYWRIIGEEPRVIAIDKYTTVGANLAAIATCLECFRALERHGGAVLNDHALSGLAALPAPGKSAHWRDVLDVPADSGNKVDQLARAKLHYRACASANHPDKGGDPDKMAELNRAWDQAQQELA